MKIIDKDKILTYTSGDSLIHIIETDDHQEQEYGDIEV